MSEERDDQGAPANGPPERSKDLLGARNSKCRKRLAEIWDQVKRGFENQSERADKSMDCWDAYSCHINDNQFYEGDAQVYWPIIRDAVNARTTRFVNQLFPQGGNYIDAVSGDGARPHAIVALVNHYITAAKTKTKVAKTLSRHGDIEGHYNLYVDWSAIGRQLVNRVKRPPTVKIASEEIGLPGEEIEDIEIEDVVDARPAFEVLHDSDVMVWPSTADSIDEALAAGGGVAIVRRWSKAKVKAMLAAGHIREREGDELVESMGALSSRQGGGMPPDIEKHLLEMAGVRKVGTEFPAWEVWHLLPLGDDGEYSENGPKRICRTYFGIEGPLGCARNPHWNDRVPLLSEPQEKVAGVFKGASPVEPMLSIQYEANDAVNEGADVAHRSAMPIVKRDPTRAGKQPLILNIGAIWDVPPDSVEFAEFPDLTPRAAARVQACIQQIFQSLGVNPSMLPQQTSTSRRNQAQVAQEQAVDLLTTAEAVSVMEEGIWTPAAQWMVDLDYQYRDRPLTLRLYGNQGVMANMEEIPPQLTREAYEFRWWGAEQARNAAQYQQQIAWINVARGLEPQLQQQGKRLDLVPVLESSAMGIFGPRIGPLVIRDLRSELSMDPEMENELMADGHDMPIHMLDEDQKHIPSHQMAWRQASGPAEKQRIFLHIQLHTMQMRLKQQAQMAQQAQQAAQPPGGQQQPGRPTRGGAPPRQGAMPAGPQLIKGPAGMIHPDQLPRAGAVVAPRRF